MAKIMLKPTRIKLLFLLCIFVIFIFIFSVVEAEALPSSKGITVAPAIVKINLDNESQQIAYVGVKNNYNKTVNLVTELKAIDQEKGVIAPIKELDKSLANLLQVTPQNFSLEPSESINIEIKVINGKILSPGGTYASLVIKQMSGVTQSVGLQSAISVSIFIIKESGAIRDIKALNLSFDRLLFGVPRQATVTFRNDGNVIAVPRGILLITNSGYRKYYSKGIINQDSLSVFPRKQLNVDINLSNSDRRWLPGKQYYNLQYRDDSELEISSHQGSYLVIPNFYWLLGLLLLFGLWLGRNKFKKNKKTYLFATKHNRKPKVNETKKLKKIIIKDG
jgi:hypothetical protein